MRQKRLLEVQLQNLPNLLQQLGYQNRIGFASSSCFASLYNERSLRGLYAHLLGSDAGTLSACKRLTEVVADLGSLVLTHDIRRSIRWAQEELFKRVPWHWPAFVMIAKKALNISALLREHGIRPLQPVCQDSISRDFKRDMLLAVKMNSALELEVPFGRMDMVDPMLGSGKQELWAFLQTREGLMETEPGVFVPCNRLTEWALGKGNGACGEMFFEGRMPSASDRIVQSAAGRFSLYPTLQLHFVAMDPRLEWSLPYTSLQIDFAEDGSQTDIVIQTSDLRTYTTIIAGADDAFASGFRVAREIK